MTTTDITVRGRASASAPPDRGTVHAQVSADAPVSSDAYDAVVAGAAAVRGSLEGLHDTDAGPVRTVHVDAVKLFTERPWGHDGERGPLVHHAVAEARVEFDDAVAIGRWLSDVAAIEGLQVQGVEWTLLPEHRARLVRRLRAEAVQDARGAAEDYATAAGLGVPTYVAIADAGMLGGGEPSPYGPRDRVGFTPAAASLRGAGAPLEMSPRPLDVVVEVDARFTTGTPDGSVRA